MPTLRIDLDRATFERLSKQADAERRPIIWQAEIVLRRALGLPFPYPRADVDTGGPARSDGGEAVR